MQKFASRIFLNWRSEDQMILSPRPEIRDRVQQLQSELHHYLAVLHLGLVGMKRGNISWPLRRADHGAVLWVENSKVIGANESMIIHEAFREIIILVRAVTRCCVIVCSISYKQYLSSFYVRLKKVPSFMAPSLATLYHAMKDTLCVKAIIFYCLPWILMR